VLRSSGAVAQVDRGGAAEIGDLHNRVLSGFERLSRQISRGEALLQIVAGTYATAPSRRSTNPTSALHRLARAGTCCSLMGLAERRRSLQTRRRRIRLGGDHGVNCCADPILHHGGRTAAQLAVEVEEREALDEPQNAIASAFASDRGKSRSTTARRYWLDDGNGGALPAVAVARVAEHHAGQRSALERECVVDGAGAHLASRGVTGSRPGSQKSARCVTFGLRVSAIRRRMRPRPRPASPAPPRRRSGRPVA
jgi:hypothetical protein